MKLRIQIKTTTVQNYKAKELPTSHGDAQHYKITTIFRSHRLRKTDGPGLRWRVLLHHQKPLPLRVPGLVQGGARMRGGLLQLRGQQRRRSQARNRLPPPERNPGQQPVGQARPGTEPILHGQDEHQIR